MSATCFHCGSSAVRTIRAADKHTYCIECRAHEFQSQRFTRQEWDAWVEKVPNLDAPNALDKVN